MGGQSHKLPKCRLGTVRANGGLIRDKRLSAGYSIRSFADKVRISDKTVRRVEKCECCFEYLLRAIANALAISPYTLIIHPDQRINNLLTGAAVPKLHDPVIPLQMILESFAARTSIDETLELISILEDFIQRAKVRGRFIVDSVHDGSVIVSLLLDQYDFKAAFRAKLKGDLQAVSYNLRLIGLDGNLCTTDIDTAYKMLMLLKMAGYNIDETSSEMRVGIKRVTQLYTIIDTLPPSVRKGILLGVTSLSSFIS